MAGETKTGAGGETDLLKLLAGKSPEEIQALAKRAETAAKGGVAGQACKDEGQYRSVSKDYWSAGKLGTTFNELVTTGSFGSITYEGFSALTILAEIITLGGEDHKSDIVTMTAIGLARANLREDQLEKTSKEGQKIIRDLMKKYNIPMRVKDKKLSLARHSITFTRVVSTFPNVAAQLLSQWGVKNGVEAKVLRVVDGLDTNTLPGAVRFPAFAALIHPDQKQKHIYMAVAEAWTYCFLKTIKAKDSDIETARNNVATVLHKHSYSAEEAADFFVHLRIVKDGKIKPSCMKLAKAWSNLIKKKNGDEKAEDKKDEKKDDDDLGDGTV